jgi:hypothetical protein
VGPARRRDNAGTATPEGEISRLDPRTALPGETAVIGKFHDAIRTRSIAHCLLDADEPRFDTIDACFAHDTSTDQQFLKK